MGWTPLHIKTWDSVIRQYCRFVYMDNNRLNKCVFVWSDSFIHSIRNWNKLLYDRLVSLGLHDYCDISIQMDSKVLIPLVSTGNMDKYISDWYCDLNRDKAVRGSGGNKLRTYNTYKLCYDTLC